MFDERVLSSGDPSLKLVKTKLDVLISYSLAQRSFYFRSSNLFLKEESSSLEVQRMTDSTVQILGEVFQKNFFFLIRNVR